MSATILPYSVVALWDNPQEQTSHQQTIEANTPNQNRELWDEFLNNFGRGAEGVAEIFTTVTSETAEIFNAAFGKDRTVGSNPVATSPENRKPWEWVNPLTWGNGEDKTSTAAPTFSAQNMLLLGGVVIGAYLLFKKVR